MPSKRREIVLDGYCFVGFAHRVTVTAKGNMDEEELKAIAKSYEEHYASSRRGGALHSGKWQWCLNSKECHRAVYAPLNEIEKCQGKIVCSHYCSNKVRWTKKSEPSEKRSKLEAEREQRRKKTAAAKKTRQAFKRPGKKELIQLIKEHEGHQLEIIESLKKQGINVSQPALSNLINEDEQTRELTKEMRQARTQRKVKERAVRQALEYPGKEELKQLLREHEANISQITRLLQGQGKKVRELQISILINQDEETRELAKEIRDAVHYPGYPGPKEKVVTPQTEKPAAKEEAECLPEATAKKEEDLPLSEEEAELLSVYEEGDSAQVLSDKTKKPGGRIDIIITSILTRKHVTTLGEAKLKSQEELVSR